MNIAVLTGSSCLSKSIKTSIQSVLHTYSLAEAHVETFAELEDLYAICREHLVDLIFITIPMAINEWSLLQRILSCFSYRTFLVLMVSPSDSLEDIFSLSPNYLIRTDHLASDLNRIFYHVILYSEYSRKIITIQQRNDDNDLRTISIKLCQVRYLSSEAHRIIFHADREYSHTKSLKYYEEQFFPYGFVRTHSKYLVNSRFIQKILYENVVLSDQTLIPLSRDRVRKAQEYFSFFGGAF